MDLKDLEGLDKQLREVQEQSAVEKYNEAAVYGAEEREKYSEEMKAEREERAEKIQEFRRTRTKQEIWAIVVIVVAMILVAFFMPRAINAVIEMLH